MTTHARSYTYCLALIERCNCCSYIFHCLICQCVYFTDLSERWRDYTIVTEDESNPPSRSTSPDLASPKLTTSKLLVTTTKVCTKLYLYKSS